MLYEIEYRRPNEAGITGRVRVPSANDVESHTSRLMNQGYVITNVHALKGQTIPDVHALEVGQTNTGRPACSSFES